MKIQCPRCNQTSKFKVDDPEESPVVVCPKCKKAFFIKEPANAHVDVETDADAQEEEKGPPPDIYRRRQQSKRYLVLVVLLLVTVLTYQWITSIRGEEVLLESRNTAAKVALRRMAVAQEAYYADAMTYASDVKSLKDYRPVSEVEAWITYADGREFKAVAIHRRSPKGLIYQSAHGGLQPGVYIR